MTRIFTELRFTIFNTRMNSTANFIPALGKFPDEDVNTHKDRYTAYSIYAWVQENGPNKFRFVLDYRIQEQNRDWTRLQGGGVRDFEIPSLATNVYIGKAGAMNAHFDSLQKGKRHTWSNITGAPGLSGTYLEEVWRKIDGPGDDTKNGNAGILANVVIPIEYDLPDTTPLYVVSGASRFLLSEAKGFSIWNGESFIESMEQKIDPELSVLMKKAGAKEVSVL